MATLESAGNDPAPGVPSPACIAQRIGRLEVLAVVLCFFFGIAIMLNTHSLGDGMWFWYAQIFLHGKRLYSDTHLALQPLYILETACAQRLLGIGWVVSKVPAIIHLVLYLLGLMLIVKRLAWSNAKRAILLFCVFLISIFFNAYRFDDYHVVADCFQLFSLVALFHLSMAGNRRQALALASTLGILSGLSITTRVNDGGILGVTVLLAVFTVVRKDKLLALTTTALGTGITVLAIVHLTGDSFRDYLYNSVLHAAASKGGAGSVLAAPLHLPVQTIKELLHSWRSSACAAYSIFVTAGVAWVASADRVTYRKRFWQRAGLVGGLFVMSFPLFAFQFWNAGPVYGLAGAVALVLMVADAVVLVRLFLAWAGRPVEGWTPLEVLLFVPSGQLASGSMSSGGTYLGLYMPLATFYMLWAIVSPWKPKVRWQIVAYLTLASCFALPVIPYKSMEPFDWHNYHDGPLFRDRVWYQHPVYGWMYIQRPNLQLAEALCGPVTSSSAPTLFTLPLPYFNYFCAVPPWHDTVQTFFDTSGKEAIDRILAGLQYDPPQWIIYQRQLEILRQHEIRYNHGNPLPHRALDDLLMARTRTGKWKIVIKQGDPEKTEWYLIQVTKR